MARKGPVARPWPHRFITKFVVLGDDACWPWTASLLRNGYGRFGFAAGDIRLAHRVAYEFWIGPVPEGLQVDHVREWGCTMRHCVNPNHLEAVTQRENLLRGNGWAGLNSRKVRCPRGHDYNAENTLIYSGRRECRECNRQACARYYRQHNQES